MQICRVDSYAVPVKFMQVIQSREQGYPIIVSSIPRETKALYSLRDPSEVLIFLSRLAKWRKTAY